MRIKGFTLVELSIVLVTIGLIVSGIVGGQSLIKSAKIKNIGTEGLYLVSATRLFELQYDALPGDMTDTIDYWPNVGDGNGNGNHRIEEIRQFWSSLYEAGFLAQFNDYTYNTNSLVSKKTNVSYRAQYASAHGVTGNQIWQGRIDHYAYPIMTPADARH